MSERRKKEPSMFRAMLADHGIKDMQGIYDLVKELTAEVIQEALDVELEETLGYPKYDYKNKSTSNSRNGYSKKTVNSSRSWHAHWDEFAAIFKYSPQIRRIIYTTNAIENFNRQLRKVTKNKGTFVSDDALMKILYLATMSISDKWTMPVKDWGNILNNLIVHFGERIKVNI